MQVLHAPSSPHLSIQTSKPPHLTWGVSLICSSHTPLSYNLFTSCYAHHNSLSFFLAGLLPSVSVNSSPFSTLHVSLHSQKDQRLLWAPHRRFTSRAASVEGKLLNLIPFLWMEDA